MAIKLLINVQALKWACATSVMKKEIWQTYINLLLQNGLLPD